MAYDATDELLANNERYAASSAKGELPLPPVAVVACMDARLDPARVLGFEEGDAHVIRNAGGVVTDDVIRSLTISQRDHPHPPHRLRDAHLHRTTYDLVLRGRIRPPFSLEAFPDLDEEAGRVEPQ